MSWRTTSIGIAAGAAMLLLVLSPVAAGAVETDLLELTADTVANGLGELRERFLSHSQLTDREHVGGVLRTADGRFRFTHGIAMARQDRVVFRIRLPADHELVGFWHTHGAHGPGRELFSPDDAAVVRETGLPYYLIDPGGELRVLRPHDLRGSPARLSLSGPDSRLWAPLGSARGGLVTAARRTHAPD